MISKLCFKGLLILFLYSCSDSPPVQEKEEINHLSASSSKSQNVSSQNLETLDDVGLGHPEDLIHRLGKDENNSGIRDDVEQWINSHDYEQYTDGQHLRSSLKYLALSYQDELAQAHKLTESRQATREVIKAIDCLYSLVGPDQGKLFRDELQKRVFNNARRKAWRRVIQKNFEGQSIPQLNETDPRKLCPWL